MHFDKVFRQINKYISSVPFYSTDPRYARANSFYDLPLLSKDTLINSFSGFDLSGKNLISTRTSGSSGIILNIFWNEEEYLRSLSYLWRLRKTYGIFPHHKYCSTHINFHYKGKIVNSKVVISKNMLSLSKNFVDKESLAFYLTQLQTFQPKWLLVPASFLYSLMIYMDSCKSTLPTSIKMIELNGEFCSISMIKEFKRKFPHIQINNMYGMQECNGIAYGESDSLTIINDNVYVEIVDDRGAVCPLNKDGEIVITTLHNSVMPLIRYRTGDHGRFTSDNMIVLTKARSNDSFIINNMEYDGSICWNAVDYINTCVVNNAIIQFQVIYQDNHFYFHVVLNSTQHENQICELIKNSIFEYMNTNYGWNNIYISVESVKQIEVNNNSNKLKYFINQSQGSL